MDGEKMLIKRFQLSIFDTCLQVQATPLGAGLIAMQVQYIPTFQKYNTQFHFAECSEQHKSRTVVCNISKVQIHRLRDYLTAE